MTPPREQLWTTDEDERLTKLWQDNVPTTEIARQLPGRTEGAVTRRASNLDLPRRRPFFGRGARRYDLEDDE